MKTLKLEKFLMWLFLLVTLVLIGWYNLTKPSILVLHSYDKDYSWVRDINTGLNRVLKNKYLYQVRWYYMDTKRHPDAKYKTSAGISARDLINQTRPDVVIAMDDDAQKYVAQYFANDPKIKIVFGGVNKDAVEYGYDKASNVTGILERLPLTAISETLQSARSLQNLNHPVRIAYLGDSSETVYGDANQIKQFNWSPHQLSEVRNVKTWEEWKASVLDLGSKSDVILLTNYRGLQRSANDLSLVPAKEVVAWTEKNAVVPVIGGNGFFTEDGGMLAIGTSPFEQGEVAARRALQIVMQKTDVNTMPIVASQEFIVTMSGSRMKARQFVLPKVYEAAAHAGDQYFE
jgi:ABC-type uncharacterized transport system substrate-binding protein